MMAYIVIAVISTVIGYILRMIGVNHKTQAYERAVNKCNKSRAKFFIYGGDNAREEWVKDAKWDEVIAEMKIEGKGPVSFVPSQETLKMIAEDKEK